MNLIERLKAFEGSDELGNGDFTLIREAAAHICAQSEEIARLRDGLAKIPRGSFDGFEVTYHDAKACRLIARTALKGPDA